MAESESTDTINLLPNEPEPAARFIAGVARAPESEAAAVEAVEAFANCFLVVRELKERGELDDERAAELIQSHADR